LRSSKDRSDVSIDAQRSATDQFAERLGADVVVEFADVVMSGQDNNRPGFVALKKALVDPARTWTELLLLDTARLSRDHDGFEQAWIHRECRHRAVTIHYTMLPQTTGATGALMLQTMRGVDAWHSIVSKEKGLAGMRVNVGQGYRAGGRAPFGYVLDHFPTGAVRDGAPVLKSRLAPAAPAAQAIGKYLSDRAAGLPRIDAARRHALELAPASLVGIEWNALTYAGHTVWNVHNERRDGGYIGGRKRRPRADWVIKYDTHPAIITTEQAEQILARLQAVAERARSLRLPTLLGGLLVDRHGHQWHGYAEEGGYYRAGKGRRISARHVDGLVVKAVHGHLKGSAMPAALARYARKRVAADSEGNRLEELRRQVDQVDGRMRKLTSLVIEMENPRPILAKIDELERERERLQLECAAVEERVQEAKSFAGVTEAGVARILERIATDFEAVPQIALKTFLTSLVDKIELDPAALTLQIHYRIRACTGDNMASPRQHPVSPGSEAILRAVLAMKIAA
jgi:site-specific DNA recombinase